MNGLYGPPRTANIALRRRVNDLIIVQNQQAATSYGGSAGAATTWVTSVLNKILVDTAGIAVLDTATSRLRIPPGEYRVVAQTQGMYGLRQRCSVKDVTNNRRYAIGPAPHSNTNHPNQTESIGLDVMVAQSDIQIELQQYFQADSSQPWQRGHWGDPAEIEVYGMIELLRVRA